MSDDKHKRCWRCGCPTWTDHGDGTASRHITHGAECDRARIADLEEQLSEAVESNEKYARYLADIRHAFGELDKAIHKGDHVPTYHETELAKLRKELSDRTIEFGRLEGELAALRECLKALAYRWQIQLPTILTHDKTWVDACARELTALLGEKGE